MKVKKLNKHATGLKNVKHMYKENEYKQMKMEILIQNEMNKMKMKTEHMSDGFY